ncbi:MAG: glutathione S-transferase family protein [Haliangiales bacterium]
MGHLHSGRWVTDAQVSGAGGEYRRATTKFRDAIGAEPGAAFPAEPGRYHLYVSYACPWAHRALITRRLKKLEAAISISSTHPFMGEQGWSFAEHPDTIADPVADADYLHQVYTRARADYTGRVSVPVLWDLKADTIVNNESVELVRMFDSAAATLADEDTAPLFPERQRDAVEAMIAANYQPINNGVYRCGFAGSQAAYDRAVGEMFARLDECERILGQHRYLCGDHITAADVCLFPTLYRFDAVYYFHFRCCIRRIADYPNLWGYVRDLYQTPGFGDTCNMTHARHHYFLSQESVHPRRTISAVPAHLDFDAPHDRDRL